MVPEYLLINFGQSNGEDRKSAGVTRDQLDARHIGWVRKPTMPMSWNSGSQDTITSPGLMPALSHIDSMFAHRFRWVICTAFGVGGRTGGQLQQRGQVLADPSIVRAVGRRRR